MKLKIKLIIINWQSIILLFSQFFISSCNSQHSPIVIFNEERMTLSFDDRIEEDQYIGDLNTIIYKDMLPTSWPWNFTPSFYRVKELKVGQESYLLFAIVEEETQKLIDLRLATVNYDSIKYCATLGINLNKKKSRLVININKETQTVELYVDNKLRMLYLADKGFIEILNK